MTRTALSCTRVAAASLLLDRQGLRLAQRGQAKAADVTAAIRRMHALQIDTISVVARSPYLVLFSRLGHYDPVWLDLAHAAGALFEYWSHAMCWLPGEDWPLYRGLLREALANRSGHYASILDWIKQHPNPVALVREELKRQGPLPVLHFTRMVQRPQSDRADVWWNWREEKAALEFLFWTGEIVIARRERFQRIYALREQVYPDWDDALAPPASEARRELILRSARALGVATEPWLRDYFRCNQHALRPVLSVLVECGELLPVNLEGARGPAYLHHELLPLLGKARKGGLVSRRTALLSPFDPVVWDRARLRTLFGFDYTISIYTPKGQRNDGYFVLPVLQQGRLIGRLDPKAHRRDGVFEVRAFRLEPGVEPTAVDWHELAAELSRLADWHGTPEVEIGRAVQRKLSSALRGALAEL